MQVGKNVGKRAAIPVAIAAYSACSMLLLIVNKVAISLTRQPSLVLLCQLSSTPAIIRALSCAHIITLERVTFSQARSYFLVAIAFLAALYTNARTLQYANVETFIVFRSSTPILISVLDFIFLGRELPNLSSSVSLGTMLLGSLAYVYTDSNFEVRAYGWVSAWYVVFAIDQVYIKYVVDSVELSVWGRSYITNLLACIPLFVVFLCTEGLGSLMTIYWDAATTTSVIVSCLIGVAMSFSAFSLRGLVSATTFTVVGTLCKIGTVIVNCLMWDNHASAPGIAALLVCIFAGTFYKQAPLRSSRFASSS